MSEVPTTNMTRNEARSSLGLSQRDRVADYLPKWLEVEKHLKNLVENTEDLGTRVSYEEDLRSLREVLAVLKNTPSNPLRSYGIWIWAVLVGTVLLAGFLGYQKWVLQNEGRNTVDFFFENQETKI